MAAQFQKIKQIQNNEPILKKSSSIPKNSSSGENKREPFLQMIDPSKVKKYNMSALKRNSQKPIDENPSDEINLSKIQYEPGRS